MRPAIAQPAENTQDAPAVLVADEVFITRDRKLIAEGNVEAFQGDIRLRARKITFDRQTGKLTIEGPIRIDQGGTVTVLANAAEMDAGLQNGLLTGARMVFDQQLQLASLQMTRVGGRYTELYKTAITSCHVCENGEPPLWQIRAQRVIHDQLEKQIYLEGAQFRILDVPVFYFPGLRLPDPTLKRATGFLIPSIRSTTQLGLGVKVPYFFTLGDNRDLTLEPYVSSKTKTLEYRYRQAFRRGGVVFEGAYTRDDIMPNEDRGYLNAIGEFFLNNDFQLSFDLKTVSDDAYLLDYGLPYTDRLQSDITLERIKRDQVFVTELTHFKTLRDGDDVDQLASEIFDVGYERRFFPAGIGGEIRLGLLAHGHRRPSSADGPDGRDVARATVDLQWLRSWTYASGLRADWHMGMSLDRFQIRDDSNFEPEPTITTPRAALTLRYPMRRTNENGVTHYLEPIAQIGWSNVSGSNVPNDESNFVEFDQGNLLDLSRFPAPDAREDGVTAVVGLNWARFAPAGWQAYATIGQIFRKTEDTRFTKTSGLTGTSSDLLLAGQIKMDNGLYLTSRGLLNNSFNLSKAEVRGDWINAGSRISGTYIWLGRDLAEGRSQGVSEIWLDGAYAVSPNWTAEADIRYDIEDSRATTAGLGLIYRNECLTVRLAVSRRYTSSSSVEPSTDFGLSIALNGFAVESANKEFKRSCRVS
ncbi:MAG: LPS assembly protein LptD [Pseudomonadota bacterium]